MERGSVRVWITQLYFDVPLQHGQTRKPRKRDDKEVANRLMSLKHNLQLITIRAWQDERT